MQRYFFILLIIAFCNLSLNGQISGPTQVDFKDTATYTNPATGTPNISSYYWVVKGGTKLPGETETSVCVYWDKSASGSVEKWILVPSYSVDEMEIELSVTIDDVPYYEYDYDATGNRISRTIVLPAEKKSSNGKSSYTHEELKEESPFKESFPDFQITLYPNPTHGELMVSIKGLDNQMKSSISVYSIKGSLVTRIDPLTELVRVDLSNQECGVYILTIHANNHTSRWRVVKE